ncbi:TPA: host cell division inhibitor Icd-like protein [Salmonella enterica subsp. enterica serovar Welikade]|nr:host cell division inhibitor Icd-like protein [Salmonella enterica subsp. enterica serovar Welikade]HBI5536743.1 host cell division inhibitor Icd-like protein [Salmonella enterica subsp. enterica serovar Welikade]HBI5585902.1 host cell division inhibitor Icd-like protein [Salmonella enterica subsp. enterica serovar Welikade]HBI5608466.1 host cell division inhibitor Icd-like protein [Salmonella enterica subsp. enterica serovar Welikade]HBI5648474.1 host cell division inhibitor Icd-like protei
MMRPVQQKAPFSGLHLLYVSWYSFAVAAKSVTGRRNPSNSKATPDAPCVFFCVAINATERQIVVWCADIRTGVTLRLLYVFVHYAIMTMVAQAGQPSGWPVFFEAGIPTPVWAIANHERRNSGDSNNLLLEGGCLMATPLTPSHPEFIFVFAVIRRTERKPLICMLRTVAGDEHTARRSLVRDYVLSLAARLPLAEVSHAN